MKRLIQFSVFLMALGLYAQSDLNVKDELVFVKTNTLLYSGGNTNVTSTASGITNGKIVDIQGNFLLNGDLINKIGTNDSDGSNFFLREVTPNQDILTASYGQMIITNGKTTDGKITVEYTTYHSDDYKPFGLPFDDLTGAAIEADPGFGTYGESNCTNYPCGARYNSGAFTWNNTKFRTDHIGSKNTVIDKWGMHFLNSNLATGGANTKYSFRGEPNADAKDYSFSGYNVPGATVRNYFRERYDTYIDDPLYSTDFGDPDYGDNILQLGNPYTSNIDLSTIVAAEVAPAPDDGMNFGTDVKAIYKYDNYKSDTSYNGSGNSGSTYVQVNYNGGGNWAGDLNALVIRPMEHFMIKFDKNTNFTTPITFKFTNALQQFEKNYSGTLGPGDPPNPSPRPGTAENTSTDNNGINQSIYQLGLELYNTSGEYLEARTYLVAANGYQPALGGTHEGVNFWGDSEKTFLYTLQENEDGTIYQDAAQDNYYINGINEQDYRLLPITLGFKRRNGETATDFVIKAKLHENMVPVTGNYTEGKSYYFVDEELDQVVQITSDFEYAFTQSTDSEDRFKVYWMGVPGDDLNVEEGILELDETVVYREDSKNYNWAVHFAKDWESADITVHNAAGQLIHIAKKVSTEVDYQLPLKDSTAVYVVTVVSEKGEVVTKKIIKK